MSKKKEDPGEPQAPGPMNAIAYLFLDDKGVVLELDTQAEDIFAKPRQQLLGTHLALHLADADRLLFFGFLRQAFLSRGSVFTELNIKLPEGELRGARLESTVTESEGKPCISLAVEAAHDVPQ